VVFAVQSRLVEFGMLLLTSVFNRAFRWKADNGSEEILQAGLGVNLSVSQDRTRKNKVSQFIRWAF
jgi:hypothetical protein